MKTKNNTKSFIQEQEATFNKRFPLFTHPNGIQPYLDIGKDFQSFLSFSLLELEKRICEEMEAIKFMGAASNLEVRKRAISDCQQLTKKLISG